MAVWIPYIAVFVAGLVVTIATTPLAKYLAETFDAIDYPSERRINTEPIPRTGGVCMFAGLCAALVVQYTGTVYLGWPSALISHPSMNIDYLLLGLSVLVIFITGFVDDVVSLTPSKKFLGQLVGACIAAGAGLLIIEIVDPLDRMGTLPLGWLAYPVTIVYLVAFTNIINLIDGLDGLAAGVSGIVSLSTFWLAVLAGHADAASLAIALAGVSIGFLRYNFHPASIFMGDSGSNTLGFLLGVASLLNVSRTAALTSLIVPLIIAGVPIIDTLAAIVRRRRGHTSIARADKGHIQHRLIRQGFDQRQAALLVYAWSAILALGAFAITQVEVAVRFVIFIVLLAASFVFVHKLHLFEPVLRHYFNKPGPGDDQAGEKARGQGENAPGEGVSPQRDADGAQPADRP